MEKLFLSSFITLSLISSFVFGIIMSAMVYTGLTDITLAVFLTILINFLLWIFGPFMTDLINKWFYKVKFYNEAEFTSLYPEIAKIINVARRYHNFPFPKIGIIPDLNPTAYTYGTTRANARIILTAGINHYLSKDEVNAVVAHELGHIVNYDFLVMALASTLVQILYELYATLIRVKGKKSGYLKIIALISYALYIVSTYLLYYLSRTREYLADKFSSEITSPEDLANALIKIAYGIVQEKDSNESLRLLESTRQLGILDVKNAKHIGLTSYITNNDPNLISEVFLYDKVNPWAKIIELSSTHPLTGNRIDFLSHLAKKLGKPFRYNLNSAKDRILIDKNKLYTNFFSDLFICFVPYTAFIVFLLTFNISLSLIIFAIGLIIQVIYKFPSGKSITTTILDQMRDPYKSPVRGANISLSGRIIGRGIPGYIFSEDVMFQDNTGMTFLDYNSGFGILGNIFFAFTKLKSLIGKSVFVEGWFFRNMSSYVSLKFMNYQNEKVSSHPILWQIVLPILLIILAVIINFSNTN